MFSREEMRAMGLDEEEIERLEKRNAEVLRERGEALPKTKEDIERWLEDMPLFSQKAPEEGDKDFEALQAMIQDVPPVERANAFKESGNEAYKLGKTDKVRYQHALIYYSQALDMKCDDHNLNSQIHSNRALVHMTMGSFGRCVADCKQAIELNPNNIKAYYRCAKAYQELSRYGEAIDMANKALALAPAASEKKSLETVLSESAVQHKEQQEREEKRKVEEEKIAARRAVLDKELKKRGVRLGPVIADLSQYQAHFNDQDGSTMEPRYDAQHEEMHWPVIFLYPEYEQSDFIQDFSELHRLQDHLNVMFPPATPYAPWDTKQKYRADNVKVYYEVAPKGGQTERGKVYVNANSSLGNILSKKDYIVPGIPTFFVESTAP